MLTGTNEDRHSEIKPQRVVCHMIDDVLSPAPRVLVVIKHSNKAHPSAAVPPSVSPSSPLLRVSCLPPTATNCLAFKQNHITLPPLFPLSHGRGVGVCGCERRRARACAGLGCGLEQERCGLEPRTVENCAVCAAPPRPLLVMRATANPRASAAFQPV